MVSRNVRAPVGRGPSPPELVVEIKALACEPPARRDRLLFRWSSAEPARHACRAAAVSELEPGAGVDKQAGRAAGVSLG